MEVSVVGAVVGASIQVLLQNLLNISLEQISLVRDYKHDLEELKNSFSMVMAFLYDAEKIQVTNMAVRIWLRSLEALAFEADNVLDEINYELLSKKVGATRNKMVKKKVQSFFFTSNKLGRRIKDINEKLKSINQQAIGFGLQTIAAQAPIVFGRDNASASRETDSFSADPVFLGREHDVSTIVEMLINTSSRAEQGLSVLPIVGMGGLGKTSLARKVFDDLQIKSHFKDNRVWVYVSRNFDVTNILKNILASLTTEKFELQTNEALLKKLQKHLGTQTYLLVLDDHWDGDRGKWDSLVNSLSGISLATGNCMIVTTRSEWVASVVKTQLHVYELKGLPDDKCWSIMKAKAFTTSEDIPLELETIGINIAKRCKGLPLAAKVVGGLLFGKSENEWVSIEKNWLSDFGDERQMIAGILKLSFDYLSSPLLKKCFAYFSIFPKGCLFEKQNVIELWMAEGLLQTDHQSSSNNMETTGSKNFNLLLQNSLLQIASKFYHETSICNMHDLVHDLACSVLDENGNITDGIFQRRYIGYKHIGEELLSISKEQSRYVRTLFFNGKFLDIKLSDFKSLHTLTLDCFGMEDLPTSIRKLKHLRYLDISRTSITYLPDSIGELYHLQTLRAYCLTRLPNSLSCLISLRHLHISGRTTLPPKIGKLTSLQTLPYFRVGGEKGCVISELGKLKDLKGKLEIGNLEKVRDKNEAMRAYLIRKSGLYEIKLVWDSVRVGGEANDESVLEGLQPHPNLEILEIWGFKGESLPLWTLKMAVHLDGHCEGLQNLMEIALEDCSECEELPMLGHLRNLKHLYLRGLNNVKCIRPSFYGIDNCGNNISHNGIVYAFPSLRMLELVGMRNLKEWDEAREVVVFPRLEFLKIQGCDQLTRAPTHFPCLKKLEIHGIQSRLPMENICGMKLTSLTHLEIQRMQELECLPDELFSNNRNLLELVIRDCPKMTRLVPFLRGGGAPSLRELQISDCLSLKELPNDLHSLNSLAKLVIDECPNLKSIPYPSSRGGHESQQQQGFISLREFSICHCHGLKILPVEMVESCALSLEELKLNGLSSLTNISEVIECLHKMTRLTSLEIREVPKFNISRPGIQMVSSLKRLEMSPSPSDSSWKNVSFNKTVDAMLLHFTSLRELLLYGMEHWECLPDGLQHLTLLQELYLSGFGIEALPEWFGNLSSLNKLEIWYCKKLRHFPSKQSMQHLIKLTALNINRCRLLLKEKRCNNNNDFRVAHSEPPQIVDSEWLKISHIHNVNVDHKRVQ